MVGGTKNQKRVVCVGERYFSTFKKKLLGGLELTKRVDLKGLREISMLTANRVVVSVDGAAHSYGRCGLDRFDGWFAVSRWASRRLASNSSFLRRR